jgi:hypothetical protein
VLWAVGLERIVVLDANCAVGVGCGLWAWNGVLCWMVTVLWAVSVERITAKYIYFNVCYNEQML